MSTKLFNFKMSKNIEFNNQDIVSRQDILLFLERCLDVIYPGNLRRTFRTEQELTKFQNDNEELLSKILKALLINQLESNHVLELFHNEMITIAELVYTDAIALYQGDPSATSLNEVIFAYPGLEAIATHRIAHFFYKSHVTILARCLSEAIHGKTGIDIHPGAQIGESLFIDHGTGLVIGETAEIGNNVKLYQGVTLGALSVDKSLAQKKRHPTIEDNCVIYSHATILGGETVIGKNSIIGGNVWITKSIPSHSVVYHKSEVRLNRKTNSNNEEEEITYEI